MGEERFTLHRRLWRLYQRLPLLVQAWIVLVVIGAMVTELPSLLSGTSETQRVREAVTAAVHEATGSDPASSCSALSPAGLAQVVSQFGEGSAPAASGDQLAACRQLVVRLSSQASPLEVADFARGTVRAVQFRSGGSALVLYVAADKRLAIQLRMSQGHGRWLIDTVAAGTVAG